MASQLPARTPRKTLSALREVFVPKGTSPSSSIELVVTIDDTEINVREFAAYLAFIDEVYGRLTHGRLDSYVRRREEQLAITSAREGSLDLVFCELVSNSGKVAALVVLGLLLKYLPIGVRESVATYRDYQEAQEIRERRKQLREQIKKDEQLAALERRRKDDLVRVLDTLYVRESKVLLRARRFSVEHVHRVTFQLRQERSDQDD
jgi:hypothetical protein